MEGGGLFSSSVLCRRPPPFVPWLRRHRGERPLLPAAADAAAAAGAAAGAAAAAVNAGAARPLDGRAVGGRLCGAAGAPP